MSDASDPTSGLDFYSTSRSSSPVPSFSATGADGTGAHGTGADGTGAHGTGADGNGADGTAAIRMLRIVDGGTASYSHPSSSSSCSAAEAASAAAAASASSYDAYTYTTEQLVVPFDAPPIVDLRDAALPYDDDIEHDGDVSPSSSSSGSSSGVVSGAAGRSRTGSSVGAMPWEGERLAAEDARTGVSLDDVRVAGAGERDLPGPDGVGSGSLHLGTTASYRHRVGSSDGSGCSGDDGGGEDAPRRTVSFRAPVEEPMASARHVGNSGSGSSVGDEESGSCAGETNDGDGATSAAKLRTERMLDSIAFAVVIGLLTLFVLFIDDVLVLASVPDPKHGGFGYVCLVLKVAACVVFAGELAVSSVVKDDYFLSFFFWLDVLTLVSFIPDIVLLFFEVDMLLALGVLSVARAGRAARAAARTPVLFRVMKVLKFSHKQTVNNSIDRLEDHAVAMEASRTGRPGGMILRSMTNKVTALVLVVYIITAMLQTDPDWTVHTSSSLLTLETGVQSAGPPPGRDTALERLASSFLYPYTGRVTVIRLIVDGTLVADGDEVRRLDFIATVTTPSKASSVLLNVRQDRMLEAMFSMVTLFVVIVALALGNLIICDSANRLVIISEQLITIMQLLTTHIQGTSKSVPGVEGGNELGSVVAPSDYTMSMTAGDTLQRPSLSLVSSLTQLSSQVTTALGPGAASAGIDGAVQYWDAAASSQVQYLETLEEQLQLYLIGSMRVDLEAKQGRRREKELRALVRMAGARLAFAKKHVKRLERRLDAVEYQVKRYRRRLPKAVRRELDEEDASASGLSDITDAGSNISVVSLTSGLRRVRALRAKAGGGGGGGGSDDDDGVEEARATATAETPGELRYVAEHDHVFMDTVDGVTTVMHGTINGLIEQLTTLSGTASSVFMRSFLYTFRRFVTAEYVLERLLIRYCIAPPQEMRHLPLNASVHHYDLEFADASMNWALEVQLPIRNRVQQVLYFWVTTCFEDFRRSASLMALLERAISQVFTRTMAPFASQLSACIATQANRKGPSPRVRRPVPSSLSEVPTPIVPVGVGRATAPSDADTGAGALSQPSSAGAAEGRLTRRGTARARRGLNLIKISPIELARQLKLLDHALYASIEVWELFDLAWQGENGRARAPGVHASVARFEATVAWMTREIVEATETSARQGAGILEHLIEVGQASVEMYSFNAAMEVVGALSGEKVQSLTAAWAKVSREHLASLSDVRDVFAHTTNFKHYRRLLHDHLRATTEGAAMGTPTHLPPALVPYLGIHLQDLFFADESNADYTETSHVNFVKCQFLAKLIDDTLAWQDVAPIFVDVPMIQDFIDANVQVES